ncbi:hypothetical protein AMTR_s00010p00255860 [Amborella trichopoda]|uniref:Uncharacterized protein n=1 Tax=Amborella trichopoda TaxID=13333 RepID=W1NFZ6_AMBTC|nr:hypothetical protein AMTR_s00010p00255860 [Amborella trichopoda]
MYATSFAFDMETKKWEIVKNRQPIGKYTHIRILEWDGASCIACINLGLEPECCLTKESKWVGAHLLAIVPANVSNNSNPLRLLGELFILSENGEILTCDKNGKLSEILTCDENGRLRGDGPCYNFAHYKPTLYSWEFGQKIEGAS